MSSIKKIKLCLEQNKLYSIDENSVTEWNLTLGAMLVNYNFEYKDWNGDEKPEIITNYEQFEGGGGLAYYKTKSIYELKDDIILKIVSLPIENIICQLGEVSSIDEYKYKFNSKKNELTITKTTGIGDCKKNKIKTIQSKKTKTVIIKKHDNGVISFD